MNIFMLNLIIYHHSLIIPLFDSNFYLIKTSIELYLMRSLKNMDKIPSKFLLLFSCIVSIYQLLIIYWIYLLVIFY
jgi:hypothetical protein